jgi:hypothetical protein
MRRGSSERLVAWHQGQGPWTVEASVVTTAAVRTRLIGAADRAEPRASDEIGIDAVTHRAAVEAIPMPSTGADSRRVVNW